MPEAGSQVSYEVQLDRHEAKYLVPAGLVPRLVEWIRPFCDPDPHGTGDPPEYVVTTLQLDTPWLSFHRARESEALDRFKLRVRTYGEPGDGPVFLEVKRRFGRTIVKSRTLIPAAEWREDLLRDPRVTLRFRSPAEELGFLDFVRLVRGSDARPVMLVRYVRRSYFGKVDRYARVTFDRRIECQPTDCWTSWGRGGRWRPVDAALHGDRGAAFPAMVMELKTLSDAPSWMLDFVMQFDLESVGICKYCSAVRQEESDGRLTALLPEWVP